MINDLIRTYKKHILAVLLLLCAILVWFFGCHRFGRDKDEQIGWKQTSKEEQVYEFVTQHISGTITFGTCGHLTTDRIQPVELYIKGDDEAFTGTIRITLPGEDGKGVAYQSAVRCPAGSSRKVILSVPRLGNVSYFSLEILDQYGTEQLARMVINKAGSDRAADSGEDDGKKTVGIGILSDDVEKLGWLDGLEVTSKDTCFVYDVVPLNKKDVLEGTAHLESLSAVIFDNYDSGRLGFRENRCLERWIMDTGGVLIVGTGRHAGKVLPGLTNLTGVAAQNHKSQSLQFYDDDEAIGYLSVETSGIRFADKSGWDTDGISFPVSCYKKSLGKGRLALLTWSFTDDAFRQWTGREKMAQDLFESLMPGICHPDFEDEDRAWYLRTKLYSWLASRVPGTFYYAIFFIVYLFVLFFFAYFFLKRTRKREYIWLIVPALSLLFTISLAIRAGGFGSNGSNSCSVIEIVDPADVFADVFLLYQNNEGERQHIKLLPDVASVEPMDYDYRIEENDVGSLSRLRQDYTINNAQNGFEIVFEETIPGTSRLLQMKEKTSLAQSSSFFTASMTFDYTSFYGRITNASAWDFSRVLLIRGNQYAVLKDVKAGEEREVPDSAVLCWSSFDQDNSDPASGEVRDYEDISEYIRSRFMNREEDYNTIIIAGITDERKVPILQDEGGIDNSQSVLISRVTKETAPDLHYISDINTSCLGSEHSDSSLSRGTLEEKKTKAAYQFDRDKTVSYAVRNRDGFTGTIYAYNYKKGKDEPIFKHQGDVLESEKLEPYLSEMNKMMITYKMEDGKNYGPAPVLTFVLKDVAEEP